MNHQKNDKMRKYKNLGGDSKVIAYESGEDFIDIKLKSGQWKLYTYTNKSAGEYVVNKMKGLAKCGEGLEFYINKKKPQYSSRAVE